MKKKRMNKNWLFWKEGKEQEVARVNLPHDAMILEKRDPELENGNASGFFPGGKYIYTKIIYGKPEYANQTIQLEFEGVYMNSKVYLNDELIGGWIYGYTNFFVDLTGKLRLGEDNELKVIADNSQTPNSRWYTGSGIYRPVNMWIGGEQYIPPEGVKIRTVSYCPAVIEVQVSVREEAGEIVNTVMEGGKVIAKAIGSKVKIEIPDAKLWDDEHPYLYTLKTELKNEEVVIDEAENRFGVRVLAWDSKKGLQINGKTIKLRGGCIHHDHGIIGACAYDEAERRRVRKLKEFGFNAIRYSHNPAGKNFLDVCDELGMYVMDETFDQWKLPQSPYDYAMYFDNEWKKDVNALISKDYNHPSVIMYGIGNEITDTGLPFGADIARMLQTEFKKQDDSRPTVLANNAMLTTLAAMQAKKKAERNEEEETAVGSSDVNDIVTLLPKIMASITPKSIEELASGCFEAVDIVGYNYGQNLYEGTHEMKPDRVILSSETFPCKMADNWRMVEEHEYVIGDFMWTAWDYLGEAGVGLPVYGTTQAPFSKSYPCLSAACGSFDLTGYPEAQAYYAAILWRKYKKPYIGVRPVNHSEEEYTLGQWRLTDALNSWTWDGCEGKKSEIIVYSIGKEVELFQDGISLGKKMLDQCKAEYETTYKPGKLEAVSFDEEGFEIARTELVTTGADTELRIFPEETEISVTDELVFVPIHVTDEKGQIKMSTDKRIQVTVDGGGELLALGSGNPETKESFSKDVYASWHGRVLAVVRNKGAEGVIRVTASANGAENATAEINVKNKQCDN